MAFMDVVVKKLVWGILSLNLHCIVNKGKWTTMQCRVIIESDNYSVITFTWCGIVLVQFSVRKDTEFLFTFVDSVLPILEWISLLA